MTMKKIFLGFFALLSFTTSVLADGLTVPTVSIQPGKTASVQVSLNNSGESYRAVLFTLTLPAGINVESDEFGEPVITADAVVAAAGYSVSANQLTDASYRFAVVSTSGDEIIPAACGPLFTFTIKAEATMATGTELTATLSEIKLTDAWAVDHDAEDVTFSVTTNDGRIVLDENATAVPEASEENAKVRVLRTIKANEWSTICLPFDMTEAQVKAAFGDDVQLCSFKSWETTEYDADDNATAITVSFASETSISANVPYIIKLTNAISEFLVDGVTIEPEDEPSVTVGKKSKGTLGSFTGSYVPVTIEDECLFLSGNNFWYSVGSTKMKGFRAYFYFQDVLASYSGGSNARIAMAFNSETTGIDENSLHTTDNGYYYDLQGRRVATPAHGLYIRGGKAVIVK